MTPPSSALLTSNRFLVALKIAALPLRYEQFIILIMLSDLTQFAGSLGHHELIGSGGTTPSARCFPHSCSKVALTKPRPTAPSAVTFQTMLSQDQMLNDSHLAAPNSEDWR